MAVVNGRPPPLTSQSLALRLLDTGFEVVHLSDQVLVQSHPQHDITAAASWYWHLSAACADLIEHLRPLPFEAHARANLLQRLSSILTAQVSQQCIDQHLYKVTSDKRELARDAWNVLVSAASLRLLPFGSSANGFNMAHSDLDLTLTISDGSSNDILPDSVIRQVIVNLGWLFQQADMQDVQVYPRARVPILKMTDRVTGVQCDINYGNLLPMYNTRLLYMYACIDPRVVPLAYLVKHWAKQRRINNVYHGTISPYGYVLLLIHYLQRTAPPILPNLHSAALMQLVRRVSGTGLFADADPRPVNGHDTAFCDFDSPDSSLPHPLFVPSAHLVASIRGGISQVWPPLGSNSSTVGQLLVGFFHYYSNVFSYKTDVVSVRSDTPVTKLEKGWTSTRPAATSEAEPTPADNQDAPEHEPAPAASRTRVRYLFCIEDPIETTHNLAGNVNSAAIYHIRGEFMRAARVLSSPYLGQLQPRTPEEYQHMEQRAATRALASVFQETLSDGSFYRRSAAAHAE